MDLFSCIALIVFGLLILVGYFILVKKDMFPKFDVSKPFSAGKLMGIIFNLFAIVLGSGPIIAGIICLFLL